MTPEQLTALRKVTINLLDDSYKEEIAHLELRLIRDTQAPRFEALKDTYPEIYEDFMKARNVHHETILKTRKNRVPILTKIAEGNFTDIEKIAALLK